MVTKISAFLSCFIILFTVIETVDTIAAAGQSGEMEIAVVEGIVKDSEGNPVPAATVSVIRDDELLTGIAAASDGSFSLELPAGTYLLRITFVSYDTFEQEIEIEANGQLDLGTITLQEKTHQLDEVIVESQTADVEIRFDRRIYRADADIEAMGGTALNLIDNIPSLETDIEGNISLRGSDNVRVLINGRSSSLLSGGTDALAALPAESIDRVEVIPNPSARYQAEGDAGVINIILKRNRVTGLNGSFLARTGLPGNHRASTNLNFMTNNVNWFTNLGLRYSNRPSESNRFQRFESPDTSYMYSQLQERLRSEWRGDIRAGAEIFLGERSTLTPSVSFRVRDRNNSSDTFYRDMELDQSLIREVLREEDATEDRMDMEFDLAFERRFADENRLLKMDIRIDHRPEWESGKLFEENRTANQIIGLQRTDISEDRTRIQINADYVHPIGERFEIETGGRSSFQWVDNRYVVEEQQSGQWVSMDQFNLDFDYYRNVNAIYGILSGRFGDFSLQTGLRVEQTVIDTEVQGTGQASSQNYFDLFPSLFFGYEINQRNTVQLSYSRRFSRPRIRSILPFTNFRDSRNIYTGNPELNPVYSNSYEISYLRFWDSGSVSTSLYHRHRTGVIETITDVGQAGATRRTPFNLSSQQNWGGEIAVNQNLFDRAVRLRGSVNLYTSETEGILNDQQFDRSATAAFGRLRLQWRIIDGLNLQTTYRYSGPRTTTQGRRDGTYHVNSAISKDLWDGKATLSVNAFDLLDSRGRSNIIDEPGFYAEDEFRWRTRSFRLNFVYRFSQFDS
jgi:iron complex outermembrane recepter protein